MRTIEIDDDIWQFLALNTNCIGAESVSDILRRLLDLPASESIFAKKSEQVTTGFSDWLASPEFQAQPNVVSRFIAILSYAHRQRPDEFEAVLNIRGRERKYFAKSPQDLEHSGRSVNPKKIPGSPYWVVTNSDTRKKKDMLNDALRVLGYSKLEIEQAVRALR